uniref:MalT-like TPR region domain-containing protein n=1 Tax=Proboscia inermis TaxID=420281 RepID=A0A7S0GHS7_9STRA|mmetsp:Transcript_37895/g.38262  ORF Transcript_37895/g.38262 Transcript_37895/m.38262 type:complete len:434 (+) Transcript_37895:51-1352(+)
MSIECEFCMHDEDEDLEAAHLALQEHILSIINSIPFSISSFLLDHDFAKMLNRIGTIHFQRQENTYALTFYRLGLRIERLLYSSKKENNLDYSSAKNTGKYETLNIAITLNNIGQAHQQQKSYMKAMRVYQKALKAVKQLKSNEISHSKDGDVDTNHMNKKYGIHASIFFNIGVIYQKLGAKVEAARHFFLSLQIYRQNATRGIPSQNIKIVSTLHLLGTIQVENGLFAEALNSLSGCIKMQQNCETMKDGLSVAAGLQLLAYIHRSWNNNDAAMAAYCEALRIQRLQLGDDHSEVKQLISIMKCLYDKLDSTATQAREIFQDAVSAIRSGVALNDAEISGCDCSENNETSNSSSTSNILEVVDSSVQSVSNDDAGAQALSSGANASPFTNLVRVATVNMMETSLSQPRSSDETLCDAWFDSEETFAVSANAA